MIISIHPTSLGTASKWAIMPSLIKSLQVLLSLKPLFPPVANSGKVKLLVLLGAVLGSKVSSGSAVSNRGGVGYSISPSGTFVGGEGGEMAVTFASVTSLGCQVPARLKDVPAVAFTVGKGAWKPMKTS